MVTTTVKEKDEDLMTFYQDAKHKILSADRDEFYEQVCAFMSRYPNSPHPHELLGILYENEGRHTEAMKHFRAALALDPTFLPASQDLYIYGDLIPSGNRSGYGGKQIRWRR